MKVTVEIPDAILRRAKSEAAARGISLREFVALAINDKLEKSDRLNEKPWLKVVGKLKHLRRETARVDRVIENETERIDPEVWD